MYITSNIHCRIGNYLQINNVLHAFRRRVSDCIYNLLTAFTDLLGKFYIKPVSVRLISRYSLLIN